MQARLFVGSTPLFDEVNPGIAERGQDRFDIFGPDLAAAQSIQFVECDFAVRFGKFDGSSDDVRYAHAAFSR
jgi:hypothetical protein